MVVTDTAANMSKFRKQLEEKLHLDHGFCIDHIFQLTAKLVFKSTNGQKRKANGNLPKSDEIDALRKVREFTTVLNHSTQLFEKLKHLQQEDDENPNIVGLVNGTVTQWWSTYNLLERMLCLKEPIKKHLYNEIFDNTRNDTSILHKCHMIKDDWQYLTDIKHVLQPFKEGQAICEGQKFVTTSLVPIFVKTIRQELGGIKGALEQEDQSSPFTDDSNRANLLTLVQNMIIDFEERWGSGLAGTLLEENEERGRADRQKGMKKTHLMAFVIDPRTKDLTDPIPEQDMIEIRDYNFANILNYAKKLDRKGRSRAAGGVAEEAPAEKVTMMSAVVRSSKKTPAFALAYRRQVWQPVSQTRASVLHDIVHEQWQACLTDPGTSLFVNTIDAEQGHTCGLQWWKENQVKYCASSRACLQLRWQCRHE
jgi:hypothetical protein